MSLSHSKNFTRQFVDCALGHNPTNNPILKILVATTCIAAMMPFSAVRVDAQSIASGDLRVSVADSAGNPLPQTIVSAVRIANGKRTVLARRGPSEFLGTLLAGGEYLVTAEHIGFVPVQAPSVLITPGHSTDLAVILRSSPPPVFVIDSLTFPVGAAGSGNLRDTRTSALGLGRLPGDSATISDVLRLSVGSPLTGGRFGTSGLEDLWIDGLAATSARHSRLGTAGPFGSMLSREFAGDWSAFEHPFDVEWSAVAGSLLNIVPLEGGRELEFHGFFDWSGSGLATSGKADLNSISGQNIRGGAVIGGPIVRDTSNFVVGASIRSLETPIAAPWSTQLVPLAGSVSTDLGTDVGKYTLAGTQTLDVVSAFSRVDWNFGERSTVAVNLAYADFSASNFGLSTREPSVLDATADGADLNAQIQYQSGLGAVSFQEFRIGFNRSEREFGSNGDLPTTRIVNSGATLGAGLLSNGRFVRSDFQIREVFHVPVGRHRIKFGVEAIVSSHEQRFQYASGGRFTFGDEASFIVSGRGEFLQLVGPVGSTSFTTPRIGGFLQDSWMIMPGLEFKMGLRADGDMRPVGDIRSNSDWTRLTQLNNAGLKDSDVLFSPRFGIDWDVANNGRWNVVAEVGRFQLSADPAFWGELLSTDGRTRVRRASGVLAWPAIPDSTVAPVGAPLLTLSPSAETSTSINSVVGIARTLGQTTLSVSGSYRHTDFLTRRHDLNRLPTPAARDQYGRPVYGTLTQSGGLLSVTPGTNRRFSEFDLVSSLNQDGILDYWEFSARLEHHSIGGSDFAIRYSYSRTEDNIFQRGFANPFDELSPFPDSLNGTDWMDGRSDLDVPHRVVVALSTPVPGLKSLRLQALYRFQSGLPFTPGFRDGVDANGDGAGGNDPAFVDEALIPTETLVEFPCLRKSVGRFAERNSCRAESLHRLDVSLSLNLGGFLGGMSLYAEALNVTDTDPYEVDRALFLVDPANNITAGPSGNTVNVPLIPNPRFGKPLFRRATGRTFRFGVRL